MQWTIIDEKSPLPDSPLVVFAWEEKPRVEGGAVVPRAALPSSLPRAMRDAVEEGLLHHEFDVKVGACEFASIPTEEGAPKKILICGVGQRPMWDGVVIGRAIAAAAHFLCGKRMTKFSFFLPAEFRKCSGGGEALGVLVAKCVLSGTYRFTAYKSKKEVTPELDTVTLLCDRGVASAEFRRGIAEGETIAAATKLVRDWTNMPANDATPMFLAEQARAVAKEFRSVRVTVFDKERIKKEGMGGIYGVSRGTNEHPAFIILEYHGAEKSDSSIVLVGKAVTFDSGGISIKPSEKMEEMKYDMAGGAAVIAAMRVIAALKLRVNVVGLVPATENLLGAEAYKPGDILRTLSGKTIEVINTDAEGRVIMADAFEYAKRYTPTAIVDIATLTGAVSVALGNFVAALVGNDTRVIARVKRAAKIAAEPVWELPLLDEYREYVKSDVADLKNITGRQGGVISGAAFLEAFVTPLPWAHLDVGGTAYTTEAKPWQAKGATGWGVHLLVEFVKQYVKRKA